MKCTNYYLKLPIDFNMRIVKDILTIAKSGDSDWGITFLVIGAFFLLVLTILIVQKIMGKL